MATVVTAFYEIPSKFPKEKYWKWFDNFAEIPCNLVIFTSPNLVSKFSELRKKYENKTVIIPLEYDKLYHYQFYNLYKKHYDMDYYKAHSPELYIIWAEKVKFVTQAIAWNPFSTDKFVWCDSGAFRNPGQGSFPNPDKIVSGKMNFLLLENFTDQDRKSIIPGQTYGTVRIGGGIQGGDKDTWLKYEKLWDEMLAKYFKANRFAGQDQCIIGSVYLENPELFHLINASTEGGDMWFHLLWYWR